MSNPSGCVTLGLQASFGFGDRMGLATPGHVEAMRRAGQGIGAMINQIANCGIDFLYGVEVRVDNAEKLLELSRKLEGSMLLCLGISPVDLWRKSLPELVEAWTIIADTFGSKAVFGTADAVVPGTNPDKLKTAADVLCGRNGGGS